AGVAVLLPRRPSPGYPDGAVSFFGAAFLRPAALPPRAAARMVLTGPAGLRPGRLSLQPGAAMPRHAPAVAGTLGAACRSAAVEFGAGAPSAMPSGPAAGREVRA